MTTETTTDTTTPITIEITQRTRLWSVDDLEFGDTDADWSESGYFYDEAVEDLGAAFAYIVKKVGRLGRAVSNDDTSFVVFSESSDQDPRTGGYYETQYVVAVTGLRDHLPDLNTRKAWIGSIVNAINGEE